MTKRIIIREKSRRGWGRGRKGPSARREVTGNEVKLEQDCEEIHDLIPVFKSANKDAKERQSQKDKEELKLKLETEVVNYNNKKKNIEEQISLDFIKEKLKNLEIENEKLKKENKVYKEIEDEVKKKAVA